MWTALLLSGLFPICGAAALFGVPAVHVDHHPVSGVEGLAISLVFAVVPPLIVLGWRRFPGR